MIDISMCLHKCLHFQLNKKAPTIAEAPKNEKNLHYYLFVGSLFKFQRYLTRLNVVYSLYLKFPY